MVCQKELFGLPWDANNNLLCKSRNRMYVYVIINKYLVVIYDILALHINLIIKNPKPHQQCSPTLMYLLN